MQYRETVVLTSAHFAASRDSGWVRNLRIEAQRTVTNKTTYISWREVILFCSAIVLWMMYSPLEDRMKRSWKDAGIRSFADASLVSYLSAG